MPPKFLRDQEKSEKKFSASHDAFSSKSASLFRAVTKLSSFKIFGACAHTALVLAVAQTVFVHSNAQTVFAAGDSDWVEDGVDTLPGRRTETAPPPAWQDEREQSPQRKPRLQMPDSDDEGPINESDSPRRKPKPEQTQRLEKPTRQSEEEPAPTVDETPVPTDLPVGEITDDGVPAPVNTMGKTEKIRTPLQAGVSTWQQGSQGDGNGFDQRAARLLQQSPVLATPRIINADPKVFKGWLMATHPGVLGNATKDSIIEIKGEWDDCAHALRTFGLPYTRVTPKKLSETNLNNTKIIVINCEGHLPMEALLQLRRFVAMGGFLLTTDWALDNVVDKAFPGIIEWNEGYYTDDGSNQVVDAVIVAKDPALTAGTPPVGHWQLVKKSQIVRILKPEVVKVLARSRHMREDPDGLGILSVTFSYGNGRVMHLVGHFDNNSELAFNTAIPDPAPGLGFSLRQALAANFIAQALQQSASPENSEREEAHYSKQERK